MAVNHESLNAPFGARCFLSQPDVWSETWPPSGVLIHLMVLAAF